MYAHIANVPSRSGAKFRWVQPNKKVNLLESDFAICNLRLDTVFSDQKNAAFLRFQWSADMESEYVTPGTGKLSCDSRTGARRQSNLYSICSSAPPLPPCAADLPIV